MPFGKMIFNLEHLFLNWGRLGGHSNYAPFIILGEARSGSNFLRGMLNTHPQVVTFGEIFRFYDNIGWELPAFERYRQTPRLISLMQRDPVRFLERWLFEKFPPSIGAVGFKLFYYHAKEDSRKVIWPYLKDKKDIRVIHLKRKNSLRVLLSRKKAHMTDKWTDLDGKEEDALSIALSPEECLEQFTWIRNMWREYDHFFREHEMMELFYEDLTADRDGETQRVQRFLGVSPRHLLPSTHKQARQSLGEAINNYEALKNHFKGSPWEAFFED
jgi:LPS sulfotransferase NodH